ncbi:ribonuclease catalytic domain-containing protein [Leptolyngbya sp. NIES-2104]|uniref:ribonuclease catalytic domain-containing protein n=1 Tax=Leptolyngbya sp. NIES-2104 TaxID=1552121 RepID=UPI0006EC68C2|nr:ribonuclease R family protein [Leptolyngbya sp. NIES-2104]GAP97834.1 exoribonuclease II [Leptolyngbya sp. NIES-2104]
MEKGTLVEFRINGERRLAVADRPEGKRHWIAIDDRSQSHTLHPRQITYEVANETFKPSDIPNFFKEVKPFLDPSSLEVAWEILIEGGDSTDPKELAMLLFSDQSPVMCYAAYYLLSEDKLYFKQKGDRYEPRSATQVADLKHQIEMEAQRQRDWQSFLERIESVLQGNSVEWQPSDRTRLDALERFATVEEAPTRSSAIEILAALKRPETSQAAFQLLVDLGIWSPHENMFLRRAQIPIQFSNKVLEVSHHRLEFPPEDLDVNRLDLTHLKVYTIDDESTREIDDGLSVEVLPDGREKIWIHIADPTRWVVPGDELDLDARKRITTIYLPTGMIPMFPSELATGPMSLNPGKTCCALSFAVILTAEGAVEDFSIHASSIRSTYRLTYEDVDEMLHLGVQGEPEIEALSKWAKLRTAWRQSQGAISIHMPESSIKVKSDGEVTIEVLDDSLSRQLVAEMMILTGEVAARYAQIHNVPLPFRGQPQPELPSDEELLQLPAGPVRSCAIRRCMPRSELTITPARHASLGLDTYTQVTSPIRRYSDLVAHFQIKAHLRGDVLPFSVEEVKELMINIGLAVQEAVFVERQTNRYWSLEYLRRHSGEIWDALMLRWLREHEGLGLVLLEELGLELPMVFQRLARPGDQLRLKVSLVDPRRDEIRFQEVTQQEAQQAVG